MSESSVKLRKTYVDNPKRMSKTCLIHISGYSSDEFKVLGDFGSKYVKISPTKDRRNDPVTRKKINRQQENSAIVNSAVHKILQHKKI